MENCITEAEEFFANEGSAGSGNVQDGQSAPTNRDAKQDAQDARKRAEKQQVTDELSLAAGTSTVPTGIAPTKADENLARIIGNRAIKFLNLGHEGQRQLWEAVEAARSFAEGTTAQNATFWMNFVNSLHCKFVDEDAKLLMFGDLFLHEKDKPTYEQTWYKTRTQMRAKIRGIHAILQERQQLLKDYVEPFTRKSGMIYSADEILTASGDYLNCLHSPENNAHLLEKWQTIINQNTKAIDTNLQLIELQRQRDNLEKVEHNIIREQKRRAEAKKPATIAKIDERLAAMENERTTIKDAIANLPEIADELDVVELYKDIRTRKAQITKYTKQIEELKTNLDNENPPEGLVSSGYTNGQARAKMQQIEKDFSFMTPAELRDVAKHLSGEFDYITEELAKAGLIPPEQLAAIPEFEWYAPQVTKLANLEGATNDAIFYTPGSVHAAEGTTQTPDSAWQSLIYAGRRAATQIGSQDFGLLMQAADRKFQRIKAANPDYVVPLKSYNEHELQGMLSHGTHMDQQIARAIYNNNGMVINVPVEKGNVKTFERRYYYFNPEWSSGRLTGEALNTALSGDYKLGSKPVELLAKTTSYYGQSHSRFIMGFSPVSGFRDFTERLVHITGRDYYAENGDHIAGTSLVGKYATNFGRLTTTLARAMMGKLDANSEGAQFYDEFRRQGLMQKFTHSIGRAPQSLDQIVRGNQLTDTARSWGLDKQADWLQGKNFGAWRRVINSAGALGQRALRIIDGWNDYFQNLPAFAHYVTLRKAGVSARNAAANTIDIMNMTQTGSIAKHLAVIAPFVRPTMQGAAAFAKTMGLSGRNKHEIFEQGKKGWLAGLAATAAFGVILPLVKESLGTDEKGNAVLDSYPISRATTSLMIGVDDEGNMLKLPVGFGPVRTAYAMVMAMDRMARGIMDPGDAAFEVLFAVARDAVPGNNPMFNFADKPAEFITQYFCPAPLKPFLELSQNTNAFGSKIYTDNLSMDKAMSEQGRKNTPAVWHRAAREMFKDLGFDMAPESIMHLAKGMTLGPVKAITNGIVSWTEQDEPYLGMNKPTALRAMHPVLAMLGGTLYYAKARDPSKQYYYQAADDLVKKAQRAGVDMTQDGKQKEEGQAVVMQKLLDAGIDKNDAEDIIRLRIARATLMAQGAAFTKAHPHWYDEPDAEDVKMDLEKLFLENEEVYKDFYLTANYFK